ncbi:uncharacterized protein [Centruroides vittatus]|uniref:uncharacterized protein n=1 Tax=Centruroides vittatus TaxID=120091 RepID=UPI00350F2D74
MVNTADINDAVEAVTSTIIQAAEKTMGITSTRYPKHPKPWKIRRQSQRDSWRKYVSSITSSTSSKAVWDKIHKINGKYASHSLSMLENNGTIISDIQGIADLLGETFSASSSNIMYARNFQPGKDCKNPSNYRPIFTEATRKRLFERMVNGRLMFLLEEKNYFSPHQSGFRRNRSTTDNLVKLEASIREAFVRRQHLVSVFFDIEKAYDRCWRYGILRDLH